jgi:hypothetical protein
VIHIGKEITPEELEAVSEGPDDYRSGAELIFSRILALSEEC